MIFPLVRKLGAMRLMRGQESPTRRREVHAQPGAPVACSMDEGCARSDHESCRLCSSDRFVLIEQRDSRASCGCSLPWMPREHRRELATAEEKKKARRRRSLAFFFLSLAVDDDISFFFLGSPFLSLSSLSSLSSLCHREENRRRRETARRERRCFASSSSA